MVPRLYCSIVQSGGSQNCRETLSARGEQVVTRQKTGEKICARLQTSSSFRASAATCVAFPVLIRKRSLSSRIPPMPTLEPSSLFVSSIHCLIVASCVSKKRISSSSSMPSIEGSQAYGVAGGHSLSRTVAFAGAVRSAFIPTCPPQK